MKRDIILAGVGGQGVLSIAALIARAADRAGLELRQSEIHGMAQRGGAVSAHLRLSDQPIASDLVPRGGADMIISMEVLEGLRYVSWLSPEGALVTAAEPFINIKNYPEISRILEALGQLPHVRIIEAAKLAKEAAFPKAVNTVMAGAASAFLPFKAEILEETISSLFAAKDPAVAEANVQAFRLGRKAAA